MSDWIKLPEGSDKSDIVKQAVLMGFIERRQTNGAFEYRMTAEGLAYNARVKKEIDDYRLI